MSLWNLSSNFLLLVMTCLILLGLSVFSGRGEVTKIHNIWRIFALVNLVFFLFVVSMYRGFGRFLWVFAAVAIVISVLIPFWQALRIEYISTGISLKCMPLIVSLVELGVIIAFTVLSYCVQGKLIKTDNQSMFMALAIINLVSSGVFIVLVWLGTAALRFLPGK